MRKENLMNLHTFDGEVKKIERKYMGHFIDASFGGETVNYVRLGEDLEEYNIEMNPDTEVRKNILGNSSFVHNGYEPTSDADPFYARSGDPLFEKLQEIVDTLATGDTCKTTAVEVHLWETSGEGVYKAYKQDCYVTPTSYGGDTSGYQIPFTVSYVGDKVAGTFNLATKAFTATA